MKQASQRKDYLLMWMNNMYGFEYVGLKDTKTLWYRYSEGKCKYRLTQLIYYQDL